MSDAGVVEGDIAGRDVGAQTWHQDQRKEGYVERLLIKHRVKAGNFATIRAQ